MIKASIYIPAYNAEKTIQEVLKSVFNQSLPFDEVIVVDDYSKDNTLNCLKQFNDIKYGNDNETRIIIAKLKPQGTVTTAPKVEE